MGKSKKPGGAKCPLVSKGGGDPSETLLQKHSQPLTPEDLFFWKKEQLLLLKNSILLMVLGANNWELGKITLIKELYKVINFQTAMGFGLILLKIIFYWNTKIMKIKIFIFLFIKIKLG